VAHKIPPKVFPCSSSSWQRKLLCCGQSMNYFSANHKPGYVKRAEFVFQLQENAHIEFQENLLTSYMGCRETSVYVIM
jgi:hypothetical protein